MSNLAKIKKPALRFVLSQMFLLALIPLFCSFWPFTGEEGTVMRVNTTATTNKGVPFYIYVKEVEKGEFLRHEYQQIVHEAFTENPKIQPFVIFPGDNYEFTVAREQSEKPLGIYVLYTNPGDDWKMIANGSTRVTIELGDTEILSASIR